MSTGRGTQPADLADDALQSIVDLVTDVDPAANRGQVAAVVVELVPTAQWCKALANKLTARPELLTGAGAEGAPVVIKLIGKLCALGVAGVVAPACPFCDQVKVLSRRRDGLRCCKTCWDTAHAQPCDRCGTVTRLDRRTAAGDSLCWPCAEAEPELQETCAGCGRITLASRRDGDAVFCKNCCKPPTATCSICGQAKPCYQADTDAPRCKNCSDKLRAQPCVECGQVRVVSRRTASGEPLCKDCGSMDVCTGCGGRLPIRKRTTEAALCQTCHRKDPSSHSTCQHCGITGLLYRAGLCASCAWPDVVRTLLTGPDGTVRPELEPIRSALATVDPETGVNWAARASNQRLMGRLTELTGPVTHEVLDRLASSEAVERLRTMLIHHAGLPIRDERLISAERSTQRRIARVEDPDDRKILAGFATWHHLRRLRALAERRPLTQEQVTYSVNALTASANLLNWLRARGTSLATCTQSDIDEWLATHDAFSRTRGFVTWAVKGGQPATSTCREPRTN